MIVQWRMSEDDWKLLLTGQPKQANNIREDAFKQISKI